MAVLLTIEVSEVTIDQRVSVISKMRGEGEGEEREREEESEQQQREQQHE
jgi:hypothetical protein